MERSKAVKLLVLIACLVAWPLQASELAYSTAAYNELFEAWRHGTEAIGKYDLRSDAEFSTCVSKSREKQSSTLVLEKRLRQELRSVHPGAHWLRMAAANARQCVSCGQGAQAACVEMASDLEKANLAIEPDEERAP